MKIILAFPLVAFLLIHCSERKPESVDVPAPFDLSMVKSGILEANKTYGDRFKIGSLEFYRERYTDDACIMPVNSPKLCGIDSILKFNYRDGSGKDLKIDVTADSIYGGPHIVVEEGKYELSLPSQIIDKGKFIALWKKENNQWKLYREIWTTDLPPAK